MEKAQEERSHARDEINTYIQESNYDSHLAIISTSKKRAKGSDAREEIRKKLSEPIPPINIGETAKAPQSQKGSLDDFDPLAGGPSKDLDSFFDDDEGNGDLDKYLDSVKLADDEEG